MVRIVSTMSSWSRARRRARTAPGRRNRGAAMAELVLVLPILVAMLFAITQLGMALNRVQSLEAAAREGARLGSIQATTYSQITARVNSNLSFVPPAPAVTPATNALGAGPCSGREGQSVTVAVTSPYTVTIPLVNTWNITLNGTAVFRCEA